MEKMRTVLSFVRLVSVALIGFPMDAAYSQDRWVGEPSRSVAAKLQHWRLNFELGEPVNAPEKGAFPSFTPGTREDGTARLVSDLRPSTPITLTPVAERTRYMPAGDPHTDPNDKAVTKEILDILRSREVVRFIAAEHVDDRRLDVEKNFAVALVQDFDVALRMPGKREHVWSINWRIDNASTSNGGDGVGYSGWGLFTRVNGALKPFHLAATKEPAVDGNVGSSSYYYVLAVGDLNGDGIDELIVRHMEFEAEEDNLELWAWEHGGPVTIHKIP
jgi:hypothetical protein